MHVERVSIPPSSTAKENIHHPGPFEQGLHQMTTTLEKGIDAVQSKKASSPGYPHDPTKTSIRIEAAQSRLTAIAS